MKGGGQESLQKEEWGKERKRDRFSVESSGTWRGHFGKGTLQEGRW